MPTKIRLIALFLSVGGVLAFAEKMDKSDAPLASLGLIPKAIDGLHVDFSKTPPAQSFDVKSAVLLVATSNQNDVSLVVQERPTSQRQEVPTKTRDFTVHFKRDYQFAKAFFEALNTDKKIHYLSVDSPYSKAFKEGEVPTFVDAANAEKVFVIFKYVKAEHHVPVSGNLIDNGDVRRALVK